MKHLKAIEVLITQKEQVQKRRNNAMALAAAPFNLEIEQLEASIAHLKSIEDDEGDEERPQEIKHKHGGSRRGKRIDYNTIDFEVYPLDESIIAKFRYVLKESNKVLSIAEVAEKVQQYEPNESLFSIKDRFGKHIRKYEEKGFLRSLGVGRGKKYGLPEWWENNRLLNQYNIISGKGGRDELFPIHLLQK